MKPCVVSSFLKTLLEAVNSVPVTCGGLGGCWEGVSSAALIHSSRKMLSVSPTQYLTDELCHANFTWEQ